MANLSQVVYLTKAQYNTLVTQGSITVGGVTYTYDQNSLYLVPKETTAPANVLYETSIYMGTDQTEWAVPANIHEARIKIRPYSASSITYNDYPDAEGRWTDLFAGGLEKDAKLYFTWQSGPQIMAITDYGSTSAYSGFGGVWIQYDRVNNVIKLFAGGPYMHVSPIEPMIVDIQYTLNA